MCHLYLYNNVKLLRKFFLYINYNYDPVTYHFRGKAKYWSKIAISHTPLHQGKRLQIFSVVFHNRARSLAYQVVDSAKRLR